VNFKQGGGQKGALKTREWKTREWKTRHQTAGVENAGVENAAPDCRVENAGVENAAPDGRGGKRRSGKVWKAKSPCYLTLLQVCYNSH